MGLKAQSPKKRQCGGVPGWASSESWFRVGNLTTADDIIHSRRKRKRKISYVMVSDDHCAHEYTSSDVEWCEWLHRISQTTTQHATCNRQHATDNGPQPNVQPCRMRQRAAGDSAALLLQCSLCPALARSNQYQIGRLSGSQRRHGRAAPGPVPASGPFPSHSFSRCPLFRCVLRGSRCNRRAAAVRFATAAEPTRRGRRTGARVQTCVGLCGYSEYPV